MASRSLYSISLISPISGLRSQVRYRITTARTRRLEKLGISADGKSLPVPNKNKLFPRLYPCMVVNKDGSTYTVHTGYPYHVITLPSKIKEGEEQGKGKKKKSSLIIPEEEEKEREREEETWNQYKDFIR